MTNFQSVASAVPTTISSKITQEHLARQALLYVRQSTSHQLREHQESTERQYQLTQRLVALERFKHASSGIPPRQTSYRCRSG